LLAHFLKKKSAKAVFRTRWETPNRPPNIKCIVPPCFGDHFVEKEGSLPTHNLPVEKVGGLEVFLYKADQNFELIKNSSLNLKN
jgi:hypothetical protein